MKILICATGSVAAIKTPTIAEILQRQGHDTELAVTSSAKFFIDQHFRNHLPKMLVDIHEWNDSYSLGEPVLHIDLRAWADVLLIAPCSANSFAKISYGLADNLVTCIARAWNYEKPFFIAPAMNTMMWNSPVTSEHISRLTRFGARIIDPISKKLACGDVGVGAMAESVDIVQLVLDESN